MARARQPSLRTVSHWFYARRVQIVGAHALLPRTDEAPKLPASLGTAGASGEET